MGWLAWDESRHKNQQLFSLSVYLLVAWTSPRSQCSGNKKDSWMVLWNLRIYLNTKLFRRFDFEGTRICPKHTRPQNPTYKKRVKCLKMVVNLKSNQE